MRPSVQKDAGLVCSPFEDDLVVALVGQEIEIVPNRQVDQLVQQVPREHRARRIARAVDDDQLRARRDLALDLFRVGEELALRRTRVRHQDPMRPGEHEPVVGPGRVGEQHLVARLDERCDRARDSADAAHGAVDVVDAGLDAVDPVQLRDEPLAQAEQPGGGRVLDLAFSRKLDRRFHNVRRCGKVRLTDLQPDAARRDESKVDDLADPRMGCLSRARRYRRKGEGFRGWSPVRDRREF